MLKSPLHLTASKTICWSVGRGSSSSWNPRVSVVAASSNVHGDTLYCVGDLQKGSWVSSRYIVCTGQENWSWSKYLHYYFGSSGQPQ